MTLLVAVLLAQEVGKAEAERAIQEFNRALAAAKDDGARVAAAQGLGQVMHPDILARLVRAGDAGSLPVRRQCAQSLSAYSASKDAAAALARWMTTKERKDEAKAVVIVSLQSLGAFGETAAPHIDAINALIADDDGPVARQAPTRRECSGTGRRSSRSSARWRVSRRR